MARTGSEVVGLTAIEGTLRYAPKDDLDSFFKAKLIAKDKNSVTLIALAGPRLKSAPEKPFSIPASAWDERIKGMQGRQQGFSPKREEASPAAPKKETRAPKDTGKKGKDKSNDTEDYDLESVKAELDDTIETFRDTIETLTDKLATLENIRNFMDQLAMGDSDASPDSEEEPPAKEEKKKRSGRSKPMTDVDEG